jgi:hypothetical protein
MQDPVQELVAVEEWEEEWSKNHFDRSVITIF